MPTIRPRHAVTETPEVADALNAAARKWPQDRNRPARLIRHLIEEGFKSIEPDAPGRHNDRLDALRRISGSYSGLYDRGYLDDLRAEWPE